MDNQLHAALEAQLHQLLAGQEVGDRRGSRWESRGDRDAIQGAESPWWKGRCAHEPSSQAMKEAPYTAVAAEHDRKPASHVTRSHIMLERERQRPVLGTTAPLACLRGGARSAPYLAKIRACISVLRSTWLCLPAHLDRQRWLNHVTTSFTFTQTRHSLISIHSNTPQNSWKHPRTDRGVRNATKCTSTLQSGGRRTLKLDEKQRQCLPDAGGATITSQCAPRWQQQGGISACGHGKRSTRGTEHHAGVHRCRCRQQRRE